MLNAFIRASKLSLDTIATICSKYWRNSVSNDSLIDLCKNSSIVFCIVWYHILAKLALREF